MKILAKFLSPVGTAYNSIVRKRYVVDAPEGSIALKVRHIFIIALVITLCLSMCSCGSQKMVTQTVTDIRHDTIYVSNNQFDSVYVYENKLIDRSRDTIYIRDKSIEFRYRKLTDTLRIVQRDSIPYEVTITEVKEIQRPLTLFDKLCRACFWFLITCLTLFIANRLRK